MLAAEEASGPSKVKSAPKAGAKKKPITGLDAGPRAPPGQGIANFSINDPLNLRSGRDEDVPIEELSATGIDAMMEALEVANQKTDKQAMGAKVSPSLRLSLPQARSIPAQLWRQTLTDEYRQGNSKDIQR